MEAEGKSKIKKSSGAKIKKAAATVKPKAEKAEGNRKGRASPFAGKKIKLLVKDNPKRAGTDSHTRFGLYSTHKDVDAYLAAGGTTGDLHWDIGRNYIEVA